MKNEERLAWWLDLGWRAETGGKVWNACLQLARVPCSPNFRSLERCEKHARSKQAANWLNSGACPCRCPCQQINRLIDESIDRSFCAVCGDPACHPRTHCYPIPQLQGALLRQSLTGRTRTCLMVGTGQSGMKSAKCTQRNASSLCCLLASYCSCAYSTEDINIQTYLSFVSFFPRCTNTCSGVRISSHLI
jgi:hypothetical protein